MKLAPPQLPAELDELDSAQLVSEASLETGSLLQADLSGVTAQIVSLDEVRLEKVTFTGARLDRLAGRDIIIKQCDFSAVQCSESSFQRAVFEGGRMTGLDCNKALFKDVTFTGCKLDMTNFRFATFTRVRFADCVLTDADFLGAHLTDVVFEGCVLERTEMAQCVIKNVDLHSSQLIDLKGWKYLSGVTIDAVQLMSAAPYLAQELGIKVTD